MNTQLTPLQRIMESQRLARQAIMNRAPSPVPVVPQAPTQEEPAPHAQPETPKPRLDFAAITRAMAEKREQEAREREAAILASNEDGFDSVGEPGVDEVQEFDRTDSASLSVLAQSTDIMAGVNFTLDPSQMQAVVGMVKEQFACMIGAAGTGKTTTTRKVLSVLVNGDVEHNIEPLRISAVNLTQYHARTNEPSEDDESDEWDTLHPAGDKVVPSIALVAFTGQATQVLRRNMPGTWKANVMTIHSLLGYAPVDYVREDGSTGMRFEPSYTKNFLMPWDVIFIDEASMVNVTLWHQILDASKPGCRFYMIGDLNQLTPPVGDGILGFALSKWPVFELTTVHRQKDEAANRIIDTAWRVLKGQTPEFDDPTTNQNWRVIGFTLEHDSAKAHNQVVAIAKAISQKRVHESVDPTTPIIYDPWRDRIMTPTNGYNEGDPASLLGQAPLNESLSRVFADPGTQRIVIDYKKGTKKFAVGYRVMATKNESPSVVDRVTNGLTGKIVWIEENPQWLGDWRLVGYEDEVRLNRKEMLDHALEKNGHAMESTLEKAQQLSDALDTFSFTGGGETTKEERQSGPSSHIVTVHFDNGGERVYRLNAEIEQLQIAYASTTHKAQGAEMPTAIIVVHHGQRRMLCRENLYTAVTRASQRVIILYTEFGMRIALTTQKINGKTLAEKIKQYQQMMGDEDGGGFRQVNVRLSQ
jgi:ATP-dependent exoDNAse (exonuclease V) alpha subunit